MEFNIEEINLLQELNVEAVILFGSQAQGVANENSDYDFLVIGKKENETYNKLYDLLSAKINKLIDIDIVFEDNAPLELKNHVVKYGKVLYEKNSSVFADFKEKTITEYSDFAPLRRIFQSATLARIS